MIPTKSIGSLSQASIGNLTGEPEEEDGVEDSDSSDEEELPASVSSIGLTDGNTAVTGSGSVTGCAG